MIITWNYLNKSQKIITINEHIYLLLIINQLIPYCQSSPTWVIDPLDNLIKVINDFSFYDSRYALFTTFIK